MALYRRGGWIALKAKPLSGPPPKLCPPIPVDEFRISVAETYDVIVTPREARAFTIFAQAEDRTG